MNANDSQLASVFIEFSRTKLLGQFWPRMKECVAPLTTEQVWWRPNDASNSIGNLMLHLDGNVRQWLVDSFNKNQDQRDRPAEFAAQSGLSASDLLSRLGATLGAGQSRINVKASSPEGIGALGRSEGMAAAAIVMLEAD